MIEEIVPTIQKKLKTNNNNIIPVIPTIEIQ